MSNTITGYQWGDDGSYIGQYTFPDNKEKEVVHLPPRTTLTPPPATIPDGYEAAINMDSTTWTVRLEDLSWMATELITDPGKL